jgi:hypothetical protein
MRTRRGSSLSLERLEERMVLSHALPKLSMMTAWMQMSRRLPAAPAAIGAVGDSLTDPYQGYTPDRSHARNWVELLVTTHHASFGAFSPNVHGETGHPGYAFDWAKDGAKTSDVVANQLAGLAGQIAKGKVQYAAVLIGDNDFGRFLDQASTLAGDPAAFQAQLAQVLATAEANFDHTTQTLLAASPKVKLVVGTIFDLAAIPSVQAELAALGAQGQALLQPVSQAIGQYNDHIRAAASSNSRIALADLAAQTTTLTQGKTQLTFGSVTVDLTKTGDDYHDFILADNTHPGTIAQGLIANTFISALDTKFHASIQPLSTAEILSAAQKAQGTLTTTTTPTSGLTSTTTPTGALKTTMAMTGQDTTTTTATTPSGML